MDIIKKNIKFYKQLIEDKEQVETAMAKHKGDMTFFTDQLDEINKQIDFLNKAFQISNINIKE
jgi:hypothetical protein